MTGVNPRLASVPELKIVGKHDDDQPENAKEVMKFGLKDLPTFDFRAVSGHVLSNRRFHEFEQTIPFSRSSPEMNTAGFIGRSTTAIQRSTSHVFAQENL